MDIKVAETTFNTWMLKCRYCGEMWWFRKDQAAEHEQLRETHEKTCLYKSAKR
jgi:hypothetical protein